MAGCRCVADEVLVVAVVKLLVVEVAACGEHPVVVVVLVAVVVVAACGALAVVPVAREIVGVGL